MLKLGIVGYPLQHSLSPAMHIAALQHLNISGEYKTYEAKENELEKVFKELKKMGLRGFNVTIPHKKNIVPLLDELTPIAKVVGAVNTVTIRNDGYTIGDNTDVTGFWEAIPEKVKRKILTREISIIGCGGSSYACTSALILNQAKSIKVYGRNKVNLEEFKSFIDSKRDKLSAKIEVDLLNNINLLNTYMLVNTTPIGMYPAVENSPISREKLSRMSEGGFVYDIIYNPIETRLLKDAKSYNHEILNGIEMLIRQGAASLGIWLEQIIDPVGAMRLAVMQSIEESVQA